MANTYDTSNEPLGSTAVKVLYNNASNLDDAVNSELEVWIDRFGRSRQSWYGFEQSFNQLLINSGFETDHLTYVDGSQLVVSRPNQLIDRAGSVYRVKMPSSLPVTLTGAWATDQLKLVDVGDLSLRLQLAAATGAAMLGYDGGDAVQTVKDRLGRQVMSTDYTTVRAAANANLNILVPPGVHNVTTLITVRDNQTITFMPGAILQQSATGNAGIFDFPAGVKNVLIQGPGVLRGPAFGRTPVPAPVYPQSNGAIRMTGTAANPIIDAVIKGVTIEGWDDYAIFSENCQGYRFNGNTIRDIGRDGIRFYGASDGQSNFNKIDNIAPGFGGAGANLNVYGITWTRRADNVVSPTVNNPPSRRCEGIGNVVTNCRTWKALDTHGGQDILIANNIVSHAFIGIGVDEGDTVGQTDSPPLRNKVINNIIWRGAGNAGGAGVNLSSSSTGNMGQSNEISGNTIRGFGGVGTGGINFAYQAGAVINNNILLDSITAGINIPGSVRVTGFRMAGNYIKNTLPDGANPPLAAVAIQAAEADGVIDGISLVRDSGTMFGFSLPALSSGYAVNLGGEIGRFGTLTLFTAGSASRVSGGAYVTDSKAYCRVTTAGALSHAYGVASATKIATGVVEIVLSFSAQATSTLHAFPARRSTSPGFISADVVSVNTIRVYTYTQGGAAVDQEFSLDVKGV